MAFSNFRKENFSKKLQENYKLGKKLGEGAFSTVYLAKKARSGETVAIKVMDLLDEEHREMCKNEAIFLNKIVCSNVVYCIESFCENNILYLSLEYSDGGDLGKQIQMMQKNGRLYSERIIWYYFHQICNGLRVLHEKRIMHRDLKPANVFLNSNGQVKIGDLGLSCILNESQFLAHTRVGTEYYMAPERSKDGGYNFKSDIWSLGCLLYESVTLRSPFEGEETNIFALHQKIKRGRYLPFPSDLYSEQLRYFIKSCLSTRSNDRPSADEAHLAARRMYCLFEEMLIKYKKENAKANQKL